MPKKVIIITYYWPPSGGSGVQRWLKFVKYLRQNNWEPIIFKPVKAEYPELDSSLEKDVPKDIQVLESPIWEPYQLYKSFTGRDKNKKVQVGFLNEDKKPGKLEKIAVWLRGNIFIPDARKFWIKPGVKKLNSWLKENNVDAIVSTGPPHTTHLIAMKVATQNKIPWLADFRDPWTQIDFYDKLMLTKRADRKHKRLEKLVLKKANKVVTVSPSWAKDLEQLGAENVEVITNGFDEDDFTHPPAFNYDNFTITHLGSMNVDRNPFVLWEVLADICKDNIQFKKDLKIKFIGKTDYSILRSLEELKLDEYLVNFKYLPHDKALEEASNSAILLLALNDTPNIQGIIPGKIFEYLALNRPILCTGTTTGDSAAILKETNCGEVVGFRDYDSTKALILKWYELFQNKKLTISSSSKDKFSRQSLTKKMGALLDEIAVK